MIKKITGAVLLCVSAISGVQAGSIEDLNNSWEGKALGLQRTIDLNTPFKDATFVGTHNSFNAKAYQDITRYLDPNQKYSIEDQLRIGARLLEIDVHDYFKMDGWPHTWGNELLMCHAKADDLGCSAADRYFRDGLKEINRFLNNNPREVVLLYIEDYIGSKHTEAANIITSQVGDHVYAPPSGDCEAVSGYMTKADVLAAGKQLVIYSKGCKDNAGFDALVFGGLVDVSNDSVKEKVQNLNGFPACDGGAPYDTHMVRFYEDSTMLSEWFGNPPEDLTTSNIPSVLQCGGNLIGFDQLKPDDGRMAATIWSWSANEPNDWGTGEDCAVSNSSNHRFNDRGCTQTFSFACREPDTRNWKITSAAGVFSAGEAACASEYPGYEFDVPTSSRDNEALKAAKLAGGVTNMIWVHYSDLSLEGDWRRQSDGVPSQLTNVSAAHGSTTSGDTFNDSLMLPESGSINVREVVIRSGERVDAVSFETVQSGTLKHGGSGGTSRYMALSGTEYIQKASVHTNSNDSSVYKLAFQTNTNRWLSGGVSSSSSNLYEVWAPAGYQIVGTHGRSNDEVRALGFIFAPIPTTSNTDQFEFSNAWGHDSRGSAFQDRDSLPTDSLLRVKSVEIRAGSRVDRIAFTTLDNDNNELRLQHGGSGGSKYTLNLDLKDYEYITQAEVHIGKKDGHRRVFRLGFTTSEGRVFAKGSSRSENYIYTAPEGYQIVGTHGRAGGELDKVGFIIAPIW